MRHNRSKTNIQTNRSTWPATQRLLENLTPEELAEAAQQAQTYQPITSPGVRELLKMVSRVGATAAGSDEKKSYMLAELKSSMVYYGCPVIFLTLNPADLHSPISLFYAGEKIDVLRFHPTMHSASERLRLMLKNPLAVTEYFHNVVKTIIETILKGGMFGDLVHHYGPIEYQGRCTPHIHLAVYYILHHCF
jgi:Helitron helicase-like domain at N-terminus